jgi:hypothetical protein
MFDHHLHYFDQPSKDPKDLVMNNGSFRASLHFRVGLSLQKRSLLGDFFWATPVSGERGAASLTRVTQSDLPGYSSKIASFSF